MCLIPTLRFLCIASLFAGLLGACQPRAATVAAEDETDEWDEWEEPYATDGQARFIERIYRDSSTLAMNLAAEADSLGIRVATASDGKLRVYSWISGGGTSPDFTCVTQYVDSKGRIRAFEGVPIPDGVAYGAILGILRIDSIGKDGIYLLDVYNKSSSRREHSDLVAVVIDADTFVLGPAFRWGGKTYASLSVEHEVSGQYYAAEEGSGWIDFFQYVPETQEIRIPMVDDTYSLTGRYRIFRYDGTYFSYIGEGASIYPL